MCYTDRQKYKSCRVFRTHYVYRDIQCDEMKTWSELFKKQVWCRTRFQPGIKAFADEQHRSAATVGAHFPEPPAGIDIPPRLLCHRCRPQAKAKRAHRPYRPKRTGDSEKRSSKGMGMIKRRTLAVRRLWSEQIFTSYQIVTRVIPKAFTYNMLRICAKAKMWSH